MGNVLPLPRMCKETRVVDATVAGAAKMVKRKERPAATMDTVARADQYGVEEAKEVAWPECRVEDGGVRLKVLMTRKEAAEFMARLEEQAAAESESRNGEVLAGGVLSPPCEVAWRPRLATIPETC
ncbi:hypothetical protein CFC21_008821 [Triticum aestivum]|uniref:Uncharacterized protein n=3 Tax=Triticum TaxID=4564 RepID=A0A9R0R3Q9_TRITD|nr:hypothetical protein CFC21_008821 [Triticum aestivum]VAH22571.1 unnamed protein product [Triticum turgidum subsp. durum]